MARTLIATLFGAWLTATLVTAVGLAINAHPDAISYASTIVAGGFVLTYKRG